ncbi:MAG: ABC transporter permease [Chloroflexi bacterium]|nr:ABC transporter permease [Chloroflexota bacterium]
MFHPLVKKLAISVVTIFVALTFTFILVRQMPGDIVHTWAMNIMQQQGVTYNEAREMAKAMLNYDPNVPIAVQYFKYMKGLLSGNLGTSLTYRIPVSVIIVQALPWTVFVCTLSLIISFVIGVLLGTTIAWKRKTILEPVVTLYASITQAVPDFLIALLLLVFFGVSLRWFPLRGAYSADTVPGFNIPFMLDVLYHAALPVLAYTLQYIGSWALAMKASATSVLGEDYIAVAEARGLKQKRIIVRYLAGNAILPLVTSLAIAFGTIVGGSMLVETVFGYPGIGYFFGQAIATRDYSLIQGLFLLTTVVMILANLTADIIYSKIDPRIKLE